MKRYWLVSFSIRDDIYKRKKIIGTQMCIRKLSVENNETIPNYNTVLLRINKIMSREIIEIYSISLIEE